MKIIIHFGLVLVLVGGLFITNAAIPETTFANQIQCYAPVNTWCVPATAGNTQSATAPAPVVTAPAGPACQVVKPADSPWDVLGSVLQFPFVLGQCIFGSCPPPRC